MTLDISPTQKTSFALPLALGAVVLFIAYQGFSSGTADVASLRHCDQTAAMIPAADVAQSGKTRAEAVTHPVAAPAAMSRMRFALDTAGSADQPVAYTRCLPTT